MVVPNGTLFGDGVCARIKQDLLKDFNLHTIVRLPNGVFRPIRASPPTCSSSTARGRPRRSGTTSTRCPRAARTTPRPSRCSSRSSHRAWSGGSEREENERAWKVPVEELLANNCNLDRKNPNGQVGLRAPAAGAIGGGHPGQGAAHHRAPGRGQGNVERTEVMASTYCLGDSCCFVRGEYATMKTEPGEYPLVVTAAFRRSASSYQLEGPAVCIPLVSSTGHGDAALHRVHYQEGRFALANLLVALLPESKTCDAKYLYYFLQAKKDEVLVPLMQGTANVSLKEQDIATVTVPLPSLSEQGRIVVRIEETASRLARGLHVEGTCP